MKSAIYAALLTLVSVIGVQASIDNKLAAQQVGNQVQPLDDGEYQFQSASTGQWLAYRRDGQSMYMSDSPSWMSIKKRDNKNVISPSDSNNKCMSAQWDYDLGANWAGMLYSCSVLNFLGKRDEDSFTAPHSSHGGLQKRVDLRGAKQFWYMHPTLNNKQAFHVVALDHIDDMWFRVMTAKTRTARYDNNLTGPALEELNDDDDTQNWLVFDRNGNQITPS